MRSFNCLLTCLCYSSVIRFVVHFHVCLCYFIAVPHWKNYQDFPFSKSVKSLSLSNWKWNLSTLLVLISNPCGIVHEWMLSKFMFLMVEVLILAKSILHEPVSRFDCGLLSWTHALQEIEAVFSARTVAESWKVRTGKDRFFFSNL